MDEHEKQRMNDALAFVKRVAKLRAGIGQIAKEIYAGKQTEALALCKEVLDADEFENKEHIP